MATGGCEFVLDGLIGRVDLNGCGVMVVAEDGGERVRAVVVGTGERVHVRRAALVAPDVVTRRCVDDLVARVEEQARVEEEGARVEEERARVAKWEAAREAAAAERACVEEEREAFLAPYRALRMHVVNDEWAACLAPTAAADTPTSRAAACVAVESALRSVALRQVRDAKHELATAKAAKRTCLDGIYADYNDTGDHEALYDDVTECEYEYDHRIGVASAGLDAACVALTSVEDAVDTAIAHAVLVRKVFGAWKAAYYQPGGTYVKRSYARLTGELQEAVRKSKRACVA